jgi:hypothetical protein
MIWDSSSASEYKRSSGIALKASSNNPGFSYLVGVTDNPFSRLKNLSEAGSWGGDGMMGRPRSAGEVVDGLGDGFGDGAAGAPKTGGGGGAREGGGGVDVLDIGDGDGD